MVAERRSPGGRTSTKRTDGVAFDYGAQHFTAHTAAFQAVIAEAQLNRAVGT